VVILVAVLSLALAGVLAGLMAAAVARRAAAQRIDAAVARLTGAAPGPQRPPRPALDRALDDLERAVDEQVRARREAAATERRLAWALGALQSGVVIFDDRGEVVYSNDPGASFLAARNSDAVVHEAIRSMAADALRAHAGERELELAGPPRRVLSIRAVPLANHRRPAGVLVVVEDTSERRRLENVRRDFVANISHELKTPIGALAVLAEALLEEDDPEVVHRLAERVATEAFRVSGTIDDLLELSRLEAGGIVDAEDVVVADVVAEAVARVRPAAERRAIEVDATVGDAPVVAGDRRQLVSAVANLLDNAVKYSEPGSTVTVRTGTDGTWVDISVRDRGIGIPARDLERIFERFYRVDRARSRETGGTGLGLAIVRHVASNHRGEVRVESREGAGSTFTLRLPAGPAPAAHTTPKEARRP